MSRDEALQGTPVSQRQAVDAPDGAGIGQKVLETVCGIDVIGTMGVGEMLCVRSRRIMCEQQHGKVISWGHGTAVPLPHARVGPHAHEYETHAVHDKCVMRPVRPVIESLRTDRSIRMHHHIVDTRSTGGIPLRAHRLRIAYGIGNVVIAGDKVQAVQIFSPVPQELPPRLRGRLYPALHPVGDIPGADDEIRLSEYTAPSHSAVIRQHRIFQKAE